MGYCSEVALTIHNETFIELIKKAKEENITAYELIKSGQIYQTDKFTTIYFDWTKWYDSYPEIGFIQNYIHTVPYVFKRVGEEYSDIENTENNIIDEDIYDCTSIITGLDIGSAGARVTIS